MRAACCARFAWRFASPVRVARAGLRPSRARTVSQDRGGHPRDQRARHVCGQGGGLRTLNLLALEVATVLQTEASAEEIAADELLPLFVFALVRARVPHTLGFHLSFRCH